MSAFELWEPVRFEAVQKSGKTRPLILECSRVDNTKETRRRGVVKAIGLPYVSQDTLCHEWLGGHLARAYGLAAPEPFLVDLDVDFIASIKSDLDARSLKVHPGVAIAVEMVDNMSPFPNPVELAEDEVSDAAAVLVFDLMIQNPDRRPTNPNCGRANGRIIPYDHEHAFSFRDALLKDLPHKVANLPFARNHLFSDAIRKHDMNWTVLVPDMLSRLPQSAVETLCSTIPTSWTPIGEAAATHLCHVIEHGDAFADEVNLSQES